ncbi:acyltransferase family protein [Sphingobium algorifonticola]|uniref:Glycosyl transferase n=1 Tax=Sphingobium algorifonticola TaxID=2008318 RepID=A0A437JB20_9SPHN|nr:acyltransferase family protein [Sphingobium algorifonticola]RVT43109.1 glycosyl transferase [Sphingobium algorifonticola]
MSGGRAAPDASGIASAQASAARLDWIDVARGIGIIAVVVGHVWTRGAVREFLYTFHMPLFFLLSGYLMQPRPAWRFARRQVATQGLSYVAWLIVLLAVDFAVEGLKGQRPIFHNWPDDLGRVAFGGSELRGPFTVFWFVPCLIVARIIANALACRWGDPRGYAWWGIAAGAALLAYVSGGMTDVSPLGLLTVPMALVLLWIGWLWRDMAWRPWMRAVLAAVGFGIVLVAPPLNMKAGDYGWPVLSITAAVAISLLVFRVAQAALPGRRMLRALGSAALTIVYLHVAIIHYLTPYLGKWMLLALALGVPMGMHWLLKRNRLTARLLLGV